MSLSYSYYLTSVVNVTFGAVPAKFFSLVFHAYFIIMIIIASVPNTFNS